MEGYVGEIRLFAASFNPMNWQYCQGQLIQLRTNPALYAILGTYYGGDGTNTFQLPNFSGRVAVGAGQGLGLSSYSLGQVGGAATVTLTTSQLAAHTHGITIQQAITGNVNVNVLPNNADNTDPSDALISGDGSTQLFTTGNPVPMAPGSVTSTNFTLPAPSINGIAAVGGGTAHNNMQPYLGMNYIICITGYFPARD